MDKNDLVKLLNEMTLEEKFGQLTQTTGEHFLTSNDTGLGDELVESGPIWEETFIKNNSINTVGSVLGVSSAKATNIIQKNFLEKSRLKIPLLFMHDAIHGYKTIFPIPLALSCSWDKNILEKVASYTASELRASGIHVNFSPMVDLVRDSRWGRVMESFGEDHILSGDLGKAMVEGYQKSTNGSIAESGVAACVKHFACYGASEAGVDYAQVDMSLKEFYGYYIKPYEISMSAKPRFVMSSFNSFNGEPVTSSEFILKDVLREKLKYEGILISDWGAIGELKNHGVAATDFEAGEGAFNAGVDIEMCSTSYLKHGEKYIANNRALQKQLDDAVLKVLELKNELGLFENPYVDESSEKENILTKEARDYTKYAGIESCVLLKNENVLPLSKDLKKVVIIGEFAKTNELLGGWQCKGDFNNVVSLFDGVKNKLENADVKAYVTLEEVSDNEIKEADAVILTIGERWDLSGEGHSSANIELAQDQQQMINHVSALNDNTACVAFSGRPLALECVVDKTKAILWCWYLGDTTGSAVADLLFGDASPTGKLTMSFPRVSGQMPIRYNEYKSGRPANETSYSSRYQDCEIGALFPFGHGLSYADIQYSDYKITNNTIDEKNKIVLSLTLKNNSNYDINETVILFMKDLVSKNVRPVLEMLNYEKVSLLANEEKTVEFTIKLEDLKYINSKLVKTIESGKVELYINSKANKVFDIEVLV